MQNSIITSWSWIFINFLRFFYDSGEVFIVPMRKLLNKYADVFTKLGQPVAQDIKHRIESLDPVKPIPHHRLQIMIEKEFQEVQKHLK